MEQNTEENKVILEKAYEYLKACLLNSKIFLLIKDEKDKEAMAEKIILNHLRPPERVDSLESIVRQFILSSINANMRPKVVGKYISKIEENTEFKDLCCKFNAKKIAYMGEEDLYIKMKREFSIEEDSKKSVIYKFCKSIISVGKYFSDEKFKDAQTFYQYIDNNSNTIKEKAKLSKEISSKLYNIGIALAQDSLKELGCSQFGKPDVHIIDIFEVIFKEKPLTNNNINEKFEYLYNNGKNLPSYITSIYSIDKLFWLIGSGFFYKYDLNLGSLKQNFLKEYSTNE